MDQQQQHYSDVPIIISDEEYDDEVFALQGKNRYNYLF